MYPRINLKNLPAAFNLKDAILLAGFSYQAYPFFEKEALVLPENFQLIHSFNGTAGVTEKKAECFGFLAESPDTIILTFRGSDSTLNLDSDLDLFQIPFPYVENAGATHRGITRIYQSMRDSLIEVVRKFPLDKKVYLTGHSLGADLAILAGLDFAVNTPIQNLFVYTYAAGRPGDPVFTQRYNQQVENSFRIFNVHDFIPTLPAADYPPPFTQKGLRYEHINYPVPIDFQMNNVFLNHRINCYFQKLGESDINYMNSLRMNSPGFCPEPVNLKELAESMENN